MCMCAYGLAVRTCMIRKLAHIVTEPMNKSVRHPPLDAQRALLIGQVVNAACAHRLLPVWEREVVAQDLLCANTNAKVPGQSKDEWMQPESKFWILVSHYSETHAQLQLVETSCVDK